MVVFLVFVWYCLHHKKKVTIMANLEAAIPAGDAIEGQIGPIVPAPAVGRQVFQEDPEGTLRTELVLNSKKLWFE